MALSRLGDYIELTDNKNTDMQFDLSDVRGISIKKIFIPTKADMDGVPLTSYKIVKPLQFCYVTITSRNGEKITIALNDSDQTYICSSSYIAFRVKDSNKLLPYYLYMYFNRPEFDRFSRFNSWGSAREAFGWEDMCDIEIDIPSLEVQQKVVEVYLAMVANQKVYEKGLDDLKQTSEAYIESLRRNIQPENVGKFLTEPIEKNTAGKYNNLVGIGKDGFIKPNQVRTTESLRKCNLFYLNDFVYAPSSLVNGVISISKFDEPRICTEEYIVFYSNNLKKLLPEYLLLWAKRSEFGRRIEFNSMDSVRNRYYFQQFQEEISIPLPDIEIQKDIVEVFKAYEMRKNINNNLKKQINKICPVLIKGSIDLNQ
jgi:type I restriction enzyme S subunit